MPVPLTLVLALTSVAARTRRTHPIAPNPTVLLCEHIWWLENEVEYILKHDWHPDHDEVLHEPEKYMLENIEFFARCVSGKGHIRLRLPKPREK